MRWYAPRREVSLMAQYWTSSKESLVRHWVGFLAFPQNAAVEDARWRACRAAGRCL